MWSTLAFVEVLYRLLFLILPLDVREPLTVPPKQSSLISLTAKHSIVQ
jgi:hypothetical protein